MPIAKKKDIPAEFVNQMKENLTKSPETEVPVKNEKPVEVYKSRPENIQPAYKAPVVNQTSSEKKEKYADVMNVRLSKGRRNEIKAFCTSCGITVTQYIESSFEFFAREVAAGNISISKGGITKIN